VTGVLKEFDTMFSMQRAFLRAGRITKHLPIVKGLSPLLSLYRRFATRELMRITDFDGDLKLDVSVCETIGINLWHAPNLFEKEERRAFCSAITPGSTVLDVGANLGIYTLLAAKRGALVFAIEADPENAARLRDHVAINGFHERVSIFEIAASDHNSPLPLFRNPGNSGGSNLFRGEPGEVIQGRTIDSLGLPPIDICKMDIEGAEVMALRGMSETIARSPHMRLVVECSSQFRDSSELRSLLRENFSTVRPITTDSADYCNLWAVR
jgi:FkbM family methyltransferase